MPVRGEKTRQNRKLTPGSVEYEPNRRRAALELAACRLYGRPPPGHFPGKSQPSRRQARKAVRTIYKITPASAWREAERQGVYRGSADDLRDGFIHFSTASQVAETARKHYFGQTGLFLVAAIILQAKISRTAEDR